jgi:putative alpha-1,2-mannosidase
MSAWYVFSALGFYPVCPGTPDYLIGSPVFDKATLTLGNGKTFVIKADQNGPQHPYIHSAQLNGAAFNKVYLTHQEITAGGEVDFDMDSTPNKKWAAAPQDRPASAIAGLVQHLSRAATPSQK